jgi:hypothetical protein
LSQIRVVESLNLDNTYIHGIFHKEISQRNSLCNYLYLKQARMSGFFSFFFVKTRGQEGETGSAEGCIIPLGGEKCWGKGVGW